MYSKPTIIITILTIISLVGCSTTAQLTRPSSLILQSEVQPGDTVSLSTKTGQRHEFKVTSVTDGTIIGGGVSVPVADIEDIQVTHFSGGKTALAGLNGAGVLILALGTIFVIGAFEKGFKD